MGNTRSVHCSTSGSVRHCNCMLYVFFSGRAGRTATTQTKNKTKTNTTNPRQNRGRNPRQNRGRKRANYRRQTRANYRRQTRVNYQRQNRANCSRQRQLYQRENALLGNKDSSESIAGTPFRHRFRRPSQGLAEPVRFADISHAPADVPHRLRARGNHDTFRALVPAEPAGPVGSVPARTAGAAGSIPARRGHWGRRPGAPGPFPPGPPGSPGLRAGSASSSPAGPTSESPFYFRPVVVIP